MVRTISAVDAGVVILAGLGTRFGGLKQLAPVDADGSAIMDVLLRRAAAAGFSYAVVVVSPAVENAVRAHLEQASGASVMPVAIAVQELPAGRSEPMGTAHAVLTARDEVHGPFVVANGDDLYPADAFALAADHLRAAPDDEHAMVGFRVAHTLTSDRSVSRALVTVDSGRLVAAPEGKVVTRGGELFFETGKSSVPLRGDERVSMNLWVLRKSAFTPLAAAVSDFVSGGCVGEVFLPDVIVAMAHAGETVRVLVSESGCIGVTHDEDLAAVRAALQ
jgi:bifunctional N-acetylglucosamine-1-phosphate-uridyltransferase/glucosamine-1-phosphate-acetyltransferase GlmU-like protein